MTTTTMYGLALIGVSLFMVGCLDFCAWLADLFPEYAIEVVLLSATIIGVLIAAAVGVL